MSIQLIPVTQTCGMITPSIVKSIQMVLDSWKEYKVKSIKVNHFIRIQEAYIFQRIEQIVLQISLSQTALCADYAHFLDLYLDALASNIELAHSLLHG